MGRDPEGLALTQLDSLEVGKHAMEERVMVLLRREAVAYPALAGECIAFWQMNPSWWQGWITPTRPEHLEVFRRYLDYAVEQIDEIRRRLRDSG